MAPGLQKERRNWTHTYQENLEMVHAASAEVLRVYVAADGQAAAAPVQQRKQQRQLAGALAAVARIEGQQQLQQRWSSDSAEYSRVQSERKAKHLHNIQCGIEAVLVQWRRQHAEDARLQLDVRSRRPLHKRNRQQAALHKWLAGLVSLVSELHDWALAPREPEPSSLGFNPLTLSAAGMTAPGYTLPWVAEHNATAAIAADSRLLQQQLQRNREKISIVQREAQNFRAFQQHPVGQAQQSRSATVQPAALLATMPAATAEAASMWQQWHRSGQLQLLKIKEQRAAALLVEGQELRDHLVAAAAGAADETPATVVVVDAGSGNGGGSNDDGGGSAAGDSLALKEVGS